MKNLLLFAVGAGLLLQDVGSQPSTNAPPVEPSLQTYTYASSNWVVAIPPRHNSSNGVSKVWSVQNLIVVKVALVTLPDGSEDIVPVSATITLTGGKRWEHINDPLPLPIALPLRNR